ncbi:hypothetical protein CSC75_14325 [Pseudoxanthomonas wuyuanensis]|nr:hypothetical protein CSC75_14325 [Pseudoxanthomonas wuyuanensis]
METARARVWDMLAAYCAPPIAWAATVQGLLTFPEQAALGLAACQAQPAEPAPYMMRGAGFARAQSRVIARAWTDVHFLALPCPERAQVRRDLLGKRQQPLNAPVRGSTAAAAGR